MVIYYLIVNGNGIFSSLIERSLKKYDEGFVIMNGLLKTTAIIIIAFFVGSEYSLYCNTNKENDIKNSKEKVLDFISDNKITESICSVKDIHKRIFFINRYNEIIISLCTYFTKEDDTYYIAKLNSLLNEVNAELICEIQYSSN